MADTEFVSYLRTVCDRWTPGAFEGRRILTCKHGFGVQNQDFPVGREGRRIIQHAIEKGHEAVKKMPDA